MVYEARKQSMAWMEHGLQIKCSIDSHFRWKIKWLLELFGRAMSYGWAAPKLSVVFGLCRLIRHARQLLQDNEEALCVRVLQTIKGMMCRDLDFGDKVICNFSQCSWCSMQNSELGKSLTVLVDAKNDRVVVFGQHCITTSLWFG